MRGPPVQAGVSGWWGWARCSSRCPTCWQTLTAPPRGPAGTRPPPSATWPSLAASRRGWVCCYKAQSTHSVVDAWHFGADSDLRIRTTDLRIRVWLRFLAFFSVADKMPTKIFKKIYFSLLLTEGTFTSVPKDKKSKKKSKNMRNKGFS